MPALQSLKFKDKLVGKSQSSDALLKKLKALHKELSMMDQETVQPKSLTTVSKDLIDRSIMLHKDRGVKAYAACCMADLLRLYAPDAPYTALELKDMFQFFFQQIYAGLKSLDAPWFNEYVYLLDSMASIKTVCLIPDLPHGDELTRKIFKEFFELVERNLSKKVELFMTDILVSLIEESAGIPSGVLEIMLDQFTPKNARMDRASYRLALDTCKATSDKLQGPVAQYFTDIIVQQDEDEETDDVKMAHDLIIQLNRSCPALLNNVVPQLGEELAIDNVQLRTLATQTLGAMFAETGGVSLAQKYPQTWKQWITRSRDKSTVVRVTFIEALKQLVLQHNAFSGEVEQALEAKLLDGDDKVRAAACKLYSHLDYETALHHVSIDQLKHLAERMLDRKASVRAEAFNAVGKLYRLAYPEIESNDPAAVEQFAWIPNQFIHAATTGVDNELRHTAEQYLSQYILPLPSKGDDEVAWTEQLLVTIRHLEPSKIAALTALSAIGLARPTLAERYIQCCIAYNGGTIDEDEKKITADYNNIITQLSRRFPDHVKAADDLQAFGKLNESRYYKLMTTCLDTQVDLKALVKSMGELSRRLEQASPGIHQTIMDVLRKHSLHIVNQSSVPTLVKRIQRHENDSEGASSARSLLVAIAKQCPAIFKTHVAEFSRALAEEGNTSLVEVSLQALAAIARWDESCAPNDKRTIDRVGRLARSENPHYAKFATRLLAHSKKKAELCNALSKDLAADLELDDNSRLEARLCAVAELAKSAPDSFEESSDAVITFLLKDVLTIVPDEPSDEEEWDENDEVPYEARLKILAIKTCVNRCMSNASLPSAEDVFKPVMRLLFAILNNMGSTKPDFPDHAQIKARLRLRAATSLLKLSTHAKYSRIIGASFPQLALMIQDQSFQVRWGFLNKLLSYIQPVARLDPRYHMVLFMTALDPEDDIRNKAQNYVRTAMSRSVPAFRLKYFEMPLPRLLHLLAVHPDFSLELDALKDISDYLDIYMDLVLTSENIHLLTFLTQKTKSVRVIDSHTSSENLYAVSELAQHKIRTRAVRHGWATNAYPGQVVLPGDIFKALPGPEVATKIQRTVYLPEDKIQWLDEQVKAAPKLTKAGRPRKPRKPTTPRKPKSPNGKTSRRSRKRRKDSDDESSENDGEDSDDAIEDADDIRGVRSSSVRTINDEDVDMNTSDDDAERPRRNASRAARPRASKKKRTS